MSIVVAAGIASCAILYAAFRPAPLDELTQPDAVHATLALASSTAAMAPAAQAPRRVYPYSIVPGGVSGPAELSRVIRKDRVVAAHYATFDVAHAQEKTVTTPRAVHVSYRKGDKVFWTAKKVMLAEGETLLSDGIHEVRARCANRISDTPQFPVEAHAPSAEELDSSVLETQPAAGGMETVAFEMPGDDGAGRPGGAVHAPGTGSGSGGGAATAGGSSTAGSFLTAASALSGFSQLSNGGALTAGSSGASGSTGTRPAPGTAAPGAGAPSTAAPAVPDAGTGGNTSGGTGGSTGGSTETPGPAGTPVATTPGTLPSVPGDTSVNTPAPQPQPQPQPDSSLPFPPAGPVTTPGAGLPATAPGAGLPVTPPGAVLPGTTPAPLPGGGSTVLPGGLSGGGDNVAIEPLPATPGAGIGTPAAGTPDGSPVPGPTLTPPAAPAQPEQEASRPTPIPEPGTLWLVGAALAGMLLPRRRRAPTGR